MKISRFRHFADTRPTESDETWKEVFEERPMKYGGKKNQETWSPAIFSGNRRLNKNVLSVCGVLLDIDKSPDYHGAVKKIKQLPYLVWYHPTWSYEKRGAFRAFIPFNKHLSVPEWNGFRIALMDIFDAQGIIVDRQCIDPSRGYMCPIDMGPFNPLPDNNGKSKFVNRVLKPKAIEPLPPKKIAWKKATGDLKIKLTTGQVVDVEEILLSPGKHKCYCPFVEKSSAGSAFVRVFPNSTGFIQCTSANHGHKVTQWRLGLKGIVPSESGDKWEIGEKCEPPKSEEKKGPGRPRKSVPPVPKHLAKDLIYFRPIGKFIAWNADKRGWDIDSVMDRNRATQFLMTRLDKGVDFNTAQKMLDSLLRTYADTTTFKPEGGRVINDAINLWHSPPPLPPPAENFSRIKKIVKFLCVDKESQHWVQHWCAGLIQKPERRGMTALVVLSPMQGIGKSMLGLILAEILGHHNCSMVDTDGVRDVFNSAFVGSVLVRAEEINVRGDSGKVKAYITEPDVPLRIPHAPRQTTQNRMTWYFTTNNLIPLDIEPGDRRFTILSPIAVPAGYIKMLKTCFNTKERKFSDDFLAEISAFKRYLHGITVDWELILWAHQTRAKSQIQNALTSTTIRFLEDIAENPYFIHEDCGGAQSKSSTVAGIIPSLWLYKAYARWCKDRGNRPDTEGQFSLHVLSYGQGKISQTVERFQGKTVRVYRGIDIPIPEDLPVPRVLKFKK